MFWGIFPDPGSFPNVGTDVGSNLSAEDTAWASGATYRCVSAAAYPLAVWARLPQVAEFAAFSWHATGDVSGMTASASSFDGMATSNPALAGPGPFDGFREAASDGVVGAVVAQQRVPASSPSTTSVEVYRVRGGTVSLIGGVSLSNGSQFEQASAAPSGAFDLAAGDVLFAVLTSAPLPGAEDLSVWLRLA